MNNREDIWMMQNKFVLLQSLILIAMARQARKQSGTGVSLGIVQKIKKENDMITSARPQDSR